MKREFGKVKSGKTAALFTLKNANGMEVDVTDFGATWVSCRVPDKEGHIVDVLLGYDDASGYENGTEAIGATVGRVANRLAGARFTLNGKEYHLGKIVGEHSLHSGPDVYQKRIWNTEDEGENFVVFSLDSPDGDQGYPGRLQVQVRYELTEDNALTINYTAVADSDTITNLTNHAYFNLEGHASGSVAEQSVWIDADAYTETDQDCIPTGRFTKVENTPMDFRVEKKLGRDVEELYDALIIGNGYDHNYVLNGEGFRKVARLYSEKTGIYMDVLTDRPGVQLYAANYLNDPNGKDHASYVKRSAVCFETQMFPDAIHHEEFPSIVLKAGETLKTVTAYKFGN